MEVLLIHSQSLDSRSADEDDIQRGVLSSEMQISITRIVILVKNQLNWDFEGTSS